MTRRSLKFDSRNRETVPGCFGHYGDVDFFAYMNGVDCSNCAWREICKENSKNDCGKDEPKGG